MSADITALQKSMMEPDNLKPFTEKQVLFINDTNGGSYNGSITFDTTVLSNSGRYLDYSDASIQIPIALSMRSTVDIVGAAGTVANAYMLGLKSGSHQLIDSIQVDYQNKNVVQQQSFTNFYVSYKLMSEFSQDDLEKFGDAIGFYPDSPASVKYSAGVDANGDGVTNNAPYFVAKTFTNVSSIQGQNEGLAKRIENTAQVSTGNGGVITTAASLAPIGKNQFQVIGGAGVAAIYAFYIIATIRLKDICDFFDKIPLLKGAQIRMNINYNANRTTIASIAGVSFGVSAVTPPVQLAGRTCPFIFTSGEAGQPMAAVLALADSVITVECNIRRTSVPDSQEHPSLTSCRLFVPAYTMSADIEAKYLTSSPIKTIVYDDIYQFTVTNTPANGTFNAILTNGILNPQKLVIIPFYNSAAANNGATVFDEFRSPFDSAPATTGPLTSITNFQVQVSGKNMFDHPVNYDFELFLNEVAKSGINGAQTTGLTAGLISRKHFQYSYRYYVCDLARRLQSADSIPLSVQISGTNNSTKAVDYYCFVTYSRTISLEVASGVVVQG